MQTTIEYKDGRIETTPNAAPSINMELRSIGLMDSESTCLTDDEPLDLISKIIFEQ